MNIRRYVFKSTMTGIVLGGAPCVLITLTQGVPELLSFLRGLKPPEIVLGLLVALYFFYLALSGSILFLKMRHLSVPDWLVSKHAFWADAGHALQGVLLAISGGLFVSLPPILVVSPETISIVTVVLGYALAVGAVITSCVMAAARDYVESRI